MKQFETIINKDFQEMLRSPIDPKYHIFFDSHDWFTDTMLPSLKTNIFEYFDITDKEMINEIEKEFVYDDTDIKVGTKKGLPNDCKHLPNKTLTDEELIKLYELINDPNVTDFNTIKDQVNTMFNYNLPSTIKDLKKSTLENLEKSTMVPTVKQLPNGKIINIIIVGAGPMGLFTALHLNEYNKFYTGLLKVHINVLLIDNRISEEGIKLPYSRITQFGFDIRQIQPFINQIFCWHNKLATGTRQFDFIYLLENLLYLSAYYQKIPMYFTKKLEDYESIKSFAIKNNFHYIFDCTGGRLKPTFKPLSNMRELSWNTYSLKKGNSEIKYVGNNLYKFFENGVEYKYKVFMLRIMDKNMQPYLIGNLFMDIGSDDDLKLVEEFNGKCLEVKEYIRLSKHFKNENMRYLYPLIIKFPHLQITDPKYVKITAFDIGAYHIGQCATLINDNLMYVALGNTAGSSDLGIYFGLKSAISFSKHICDLLSTFTNLS